MKELIVQAIEREIGNSASAKKSAPRVTLPIHLKSGRKLDFSNLDFDDLPA